MIRKRILQQVTLLTSLFAWGLCLSFSEWAVAGSIAEKKGLFLSEVKTFWEGNPSNVWVELYNSGENDISLTGWRIEDTEKVGFQFSSSAGSLPPNGSVVVFFGAQKNAPSADL